MNFLFFFLLWLLCLPLVVKKFCLSHLFLIDIWLEETVYVLLGSAASTDQLS